MKATYFLISSCFAALMLNACSDKVVLPDQPLSNYEKVYMPQAVNNPQKKTLAVSPTDQVVIYGANFGGQGYPAEDITVNFAVDQSLVSQYNQTHGTQFKALPAGSFTLEQATAVIAKGTLNTPPMELRIKTTGPNAIDVLSDYLLPVSISVSKENVKVNEQLQTTYYHLRSEPNLADYTEYDRTGWTVVGFSSEEPAEAQWGNGGLALHTLDNNTGTFWHSQWQGGTPGPPHFIAVDMGQEKTVHGVWFVGRQNDNNGKPKTVNVQVSMDGSSWADARTLTLENNKSKQKFFLNGFRQARYFKIIITASYNEVYSHLAELGTF